MGKDDIMILAKDVVYARMVGKDCLLSEKIDGVPGICEAGKPLLSRQGNPIVSAPHIHRPAVSILGSDAPNLVLVGELHEPGKPFKYNSGLVRSFTAQPSLTYAVWDCYWLDALELGYVARFERADVVLRKLQRDVPGVSVIQHRKVHPESTAVAKEAVLGFYDELISTSVGTYNPEGVMIRPAEGTYKRGRSWDMMRYVPTPTIDLRVIGLEEAVAKKKMQFMGCWYDKGDGLNAVGSIIVDYKGRDVGVGPGIMTHSERVYYWSNKRDILGKIIKVKYKADPTYGALRQPTFEGVHTEKDTSDT